MTAAEAPAVAVRLCGSWCIHSRSTWMAFQPGGSTTGLAAHDGYLRMDVVIAVAAVAGFTGDQLFFWLGRTCEAPLRRRFPALFTHAPRLERLRWSPGSRAGAVVPTRARVGGRAAVAP